MSAKHILLWDGDCGFCAHSASWLQSQDTRHLFEIVPHQSKKSTFLTERGTNRAACNQQIILITKNNEIYGGADAINFFLRHYAPWRWGINIIRRLPPLLRMEKAMYRTVANNRATLSRLFRFKSCLSNPR